MRFLIILLVLVSNVSYANDWLFGRWEIKSAEFSRITTWSDEEANVYIGKIIEYSQNKLEFVGKKCSQYTIESKSISKDSFEDKNGYTFEQLGIKGVQVTVYNIDCKEGDFRHGSSIMKVDDSTAYIGWDGAEFKIKRIATQATVRSNCTVVGNSIHWIADYCLLKNSTDDFYNENVQECYKREDKKVERENKNSCTVKKNYKKKMCIIKQKYYGNSWERCMKDKNFVPKSVRANGVEL